MTSAEVQHQGNVICFFGGEYIGLVSVTCLCFYFGFGIYDCSVLMKKPQNLYPIPECTYGVKGMDCEIVVAVGVGQGHRCTIAIVYASKKEMKG